jgi:hypothetical protein
MKYNIEGNIDFYNELYKSLDIEEEDEYKLENQNLCLITNKPLTNKYVKMNCGHTFNYIPLYHDIYNHKKKFNSMETSSGHLKINEIRCPYCRNKQEGVLPYYEEFELEKVNGVNELTYDSKMEKNCMYNKCEYLTENPKFNPELPETEDLPLPSNQKWLKCCSFGSKIMSLNNYGDEKCYCYHHKKTVLLNYKKDEKDKIKKIKEETKLKEKEEKEKAKAEDKKQKELEKINKKSKNSKIQELVKEMEQQENTVIIVCNEILKTGPNKGCACGQKMFQDGLCKRHYQLKNK